MSRREVLKAFKKLHRICQETFAGDKRALTEARLRINLEFKKDAKEEELNDKLKTAKEVGEILRHQVVQIAKNPETENYQMKLRKDTVKLDNVIFKPDAILPEPRSKKCKP